MSDGKQTYAHAYGLTNGKEHVGRRIMDISIDHIRSQPTELIDTTIERAHATTHEMITSHFQRLCTTAANNGRHGHNEYSVGERKAMGLNIQTTNPFSTKSCQTKACSTTTTLVGLYELRDLPLQLTTTSVRYAKIMSYICAR
jgi:hypothetical protein